MLTARNDYTLNLNAKGRVKIWDISNLTAPKLVLEQPNLITKQGADVLAKALVGNTSYITHFYIGYVPSDGGTETAASIADTAATFIDTTGDAKGYLKLPLAFPASYLAESGYSNNIPYFTTFLTGEPNDDLQQRGLTFASGVKIVSLGLVNGSSTTDWTNDKLFSKLVLDTPLIYDSAHGLAITWGVAFRTV